MSTVPSDDPVPYVEPEQVLVPLIPGQGEDESDGIEGYDGHEEFTASVGSKDWTVETLVSQMRKGRIDLDPSFQRRNAWLENRKSKLLESIMLGFPIPQIVLAEKRDAPGHYLVLDGKQRLLALRQFFVDEDNQYDAGFEPLRLRQLEVLSHLNGMDAERLEAEQPSQMAALENHSIRTVVLSQWNSERLLLSLFLRLNTGSVALSPQELRQALIHGEFMKWLDRVSGESSQLHRLLGNSGPDRRMVDAELTLRYMAFAESPLRYRGNLKNFLDESSRVFNAQWSRATEAQADATMAGLSDAIKAGFELFGDDKLCRKWSGDRFERALNRAVFDVQIYSLSFEGVRQACDGRGAELIEAFKNVCTDDVRFRDSITSTTKTADAFRVRHQVWKDVIKAVTGADYPVPESLLAD